MGTTHRLQLVCSARILALLVGSRAFSRLYRRCIARLKRSPRGGLELTAELGNEIELVHSLIVSRVPAVGKFQYDAGMLQVGEPMPDVTLEGETGPVRLRDRLGKTLVVYFYPKDETLGCTIEACSFRDQYEDFVAAGADVIGVSNDDAASHAGFKAHHKLPFTLLTDPGGKLAKAWGVSGRLLGGRVTFVFDKDGNCKHRFDSRLRFGKHVDQALDIVKRLAA